MDLERYMLGILRYQRYIWAVLETAAIIRCISAVFDSDWT